MFQKILGLFSRKKETPTTPQNTIENEILEINKNIEQLRLLSKNLVHVKNTVQRICFYADILLKNDISSDNITFLSKYINHSIIIVKEHVRYRLEDINNLKFLWNLVKSKEILIRIANALSDKCSRLDNFKSDDFSAEINALDSMLKMKGY